MIRILFVALFAALSIGWGCGPITPAPVPPVPVASGGSVAIGGAPSATGGVLAVAGAPSQTGGSTSIQFPTACENQLRKAPAARPSLSGWRKDPARAKRRKARGSYSVVAPSVFLTPNLQIALDQGSLGSCTGNSVAHVLSTWPFPNRFTETDAVRIYSRATEIDPWQGVYPPTDTGSNGASAWQAAIDLRYYAGTVTQVETIEELQGALQKVSCSIGIDWWSGMFTPTASGELQMTGTIEGGHEPQVIGWDAERKIVWLRNSWGPWGLCRGSEVGYAYLSVGTFQKLMNAGGEIDCPASGP